MKPTVTYNLNRGTLRARIKVFKLPPGIFDLGIKVDPAKFDKKKQICGDPEIQQYMNRTRDLVIGFYRPGSTPQILWADLQAYNRNNKAHSIKDAFDYYIMESTLAKNTRANVLNAKAKIEKAGMLYMDLREITPAKVIKWIKDMNLSPSTAYLHFTEFRAVINKYIIDHALDIKIDLRRVLKSPKPIKKPSDHKEYLTLNEVRELLKFNFPSESQNYAKDMFCLMAFTGMAITDLGRFTPEWVKNDKWLIYERQKTGNVCELPLIPQALEIIKRHEWPMRKLSERTIKHHCQHTLSKQVGARITAHTARHSWGCIALEFGFSMESVSKMLGHSSMRTTETIYAKVTRDKIEREMREIPAGLKKLMAETV